MDWWCKGYPVHLEAGRSWVGICPSHAALRSKSKDYMTWNQDNVSECDDMTTHGLLFQ